MFNLALFTPIDQLDRYAAAYRTRSAPPVVDCYDSAPGAKNLVI